MKELSIHEYPWKTTDAMELLTEYKRLKKGEIRMNCAILDETRVDCSEDCIEAGHL